MEQPWDEMTEVQRKLEFVRMRIALQQAEAAREPYSLRVGSRVPTANNSAQNSPRRANSPDPSWSSHADAHFTFLTFNVFHVF